MKLVPMSEILKLGREKNIGYGGYVFWSTEVARAAVEAGNETGLPVILMIGQTEVDMLGGFESTMRSVELATMGAQVPVALHLDHALTYEACAEAIRVGFSSVMIDASSKPFEENIALTKKVVERAHPAGVTVEGELGRLVGEEGAIAVKGPEAAQTDPEEAKIFVERTGIDCLAVSVGTQHGQYKFEPKLNFDRLAKIREMVDVPLVLHGGSGTPLSQVQKAIRMGINKINICTDIILAMAGEYKKQVNDEDFKYNTINFFGPANVAAKRLIVEKARAFALLDEAQS